MSRKKSGLENLVLITQLGINVMTPIFLCILAGVWIDRRFGTKTLLIFLVLGVLAGGLSAYKMAKRTIDAEKNEKDREERKQIEDWNRRFGNDQDREDE